MRSLRLSARRLGHLGLWLALATYLTACTQDWNRGGTQGEEGGAPDTRDAQFGDATSDGALGTDTGQRDGSVPDASPNDSGARDGSVADARASDAGPDSASSDGGVSMDAGKDSGSNTAADAQISADAGPDSTTPPTCPTNHGCSAAYPCVANSAGYTCRGQRADWPLPMRKAGQSAAMQQYTVGASTLLDQVTGLMWERLESDVPRSFDQAAQYCDTLALDGHDDFRVPTHIEMASWLGSELAPEYDDALLGSNCKCQHWTSSPDRADPSLRWNIYLANGTIWSIPANAPADPMDSSGGLHLVRCVRTHEQRYAGTNANRLSTNAAGVILDRATGLSWQQSVQGAQSDILYSAADTHCAALELDGKSDWRLPTILELLTTVDLGQAGPTALVSPFLGPTGSLDCYWASTRSAFVTEREERFVMSPNGDSFSYQLTLADSNCAARCVRK